MAIASACDAILLGECEVAIAGGSEALCRVVLSGFHSLKVVAADGCRPFDKNRPGITGGEGAGMLVLESAEHARARGAEALAYVRGVGITCDAHHITAPDPEARQAVRAMREALERAGVSAGDVDYINAHGTGTRDNDVMETLAIRTTFAECATPPPVSSTKRCTGHTFGAAGVIEAIVCVQAIREGIVPANAGSVEGDTALRIPVVRGESLRREVRAAMSTNFAFGGNNTAMVFSRESGES
jgi:3-oxoacyl-(acyl-carrier-protein) synthase